MFYVENFDNPEDAFKALDTEYINGHTFFFTADEAMY
jgi:hypothetical protein